MGNLLRAEEYQQKKLPGLHPAPLLLLHPPPLRTAYCHTHTLLYLPRTFFHLPTSALIFTSNAGFES